MDLKHCSTETVLYHSSVMINIWKTNFYTFQILLNYGTTKKILGAGKIYRRDTIYQIYGHWYKIEFYFDVGLVYFWTGGTNI